MLKRAGIIIILGVILAGCSAKYTPKLVQHIKGSSFSATENGYYTAELVMKPKRPHVGLNPTLLYMIIQVPMSPD